MSAQFCSNISDTQGAACCPQPVFESVAACRAAVEPFLDASLEAAQAAGLEYSAACLESMIRARACPDQTTASFLPCEEDCQVMFGDKPEGSACEAFGHRMSDCEQGLVCAADGTCRAPCALELVAPEGGYCGPTRGMWFVSCDVGLACAADGRCQVASALGEACDPLTSCAVEGWCDATACRRSAW